MKLLILWQTTIHSIKKLKKYTSRLKTKPWITAAFQNSIKIKNKLIENHISKKDITLKNEIHVEYKKYRNVQPHVWFRYIDDIFFIWNHSEDELNKFLEFIQSGSSFEKKLYI